MNCEKKYYIGADLGTSALKLLLVDSSGEILNKVSKSYPLSFPKPGYSEQSPKDWWNAFVCGIHELLADYDPLCVKGIGVGGQMHGLVILDKNDSVIRPAILWNDGRTDKETDYLNNVIGKENLLSYTGNIAFAGFTAPKILWVKENEKENFEKIEKIMLPKDYINYRLTGVHCTDYSDASGMLLLDCKNKRYSKEMLEICGINENMLPRLYESCEKVGSLLPTVAKELGLSKDVTVVAGAGDNAAASIGAGCVGAGDCNISLGTSGTVFMPCEEFSSAAEGAVHAFCHANGKYHLMSCILSAASCNKWFCEDILGTSDFAAEEKNITLDDLGNNHVYFLPYLMGERSPINDTDARGAFVGMRMDTSRKDMLLAVLEGVAFAIRENMDIAKEAGFKQSEYSVTTVCGGGAKSSIWRHILANVLGRVITPLVVEEGPGYGGAILAMVGSGEYESVEDCINSFVGYNSGTVYFKEIVDRYEEKYQKFKKLYPALKNVYKEIK